MSEDVPIEMTFLSRPITAVFTREGLLPSVRSNVAVEVGLDCRHVRTVGALVDGFQ